MDKIYNCNTANSTNNIYNASRVSFWNDLEKSTMIPDTTLLRFIFKLYFLLSLHFGSQSVLYGR